jgi:hypothetical protein
LAEICKLPRFERRRLNCGLRHRCALKRLLHASGRNNDVSQPVLRRWSVRYVRRSRRWRRRWQGFGQCRLHAKACKAGSASGRKKRSIWHCRPPPNSHRIRRQPNLRQIASLDGGRSFRLARPSLPVHQ